MRQMLEKILSYYANECTVQTADGEKTVRAFVEPVKSHSKEGFLKTYHALGEIPNGRYVYIGPVSALPEENGSVFMNGQEFAVCRAETLLVQGEPVYVWGLLREVGGSCNAETN